MSSSNGSARQARTSTGEPPEPGLARELSEFARELQATRDPDQMQQRIVDAALDEIDDATWAGIMILDRKGVVTTARTDEVVVQIDSYQYSCGNDESTGLLLASHAAIAINGKRTESHLQSALGHRDAIGQAKGILMERYRVDAATAFDLLVLSSQRTHRKLRDIADELAATGHLPGAE